jgi:hypothetical protein
MMPGHHDPALTDRSQDVLGDALSAGPDRQSAVETEIDVHAVPGQRRRDALPIPADVDEDIPADLARLAIRGVEALDVQRLEPRRLPSKPLGHNFMHRAVDAAAGFLAPPLFGQLDQMGPAVKRPIPDEEVVLDVADVPFGLALGAGPPRATRPGAKAVMQGEILEARVEADLLRVVSQDGRLVVEPTNCSRNG